MKVFSEFFILFMTTITTSLSTLLCIIGFLTPGWHFNKYRSLFCDQCPQTPITSAVIAIILLIICLVLLILLVAGIIDQKQVPVIRCIVPLLLFIGTIFLLATLTSYLHFVQPNRGYSYYLIIVAFVFAYVASLLAAFWLGNGGFVSKSYSVERVVGNR